LLNKAETQPRRTATKNLPIEKANKNIDYVRTKRYIFCMIFSFSAEKNEVLYKVRGITFSQVIEAIEQNGVLLDFFHPNRIKYPKQMIMVIKLNDYTYCVPYVVNGEELFLKTAYPNRKFLYLIEQEERRND